MGSTLSFAILSAEGHLDIKLAFFNCNFASVYCNAMYVVFTDVLQQGAAKSLGPIGEPLWRALHRLQSGRQKGILISSWRSSIQTFSISTVLPCSFLFADVLQQEAAKSLGPTGEPLWIALYRLQSSRRKGILISSRLSSIITFPVATVSP